MKKISVLLTLTAVSIIVLGQNNGRKTISQSLISLIYTADISAHIFNSKIYRFASSDSKTISSPY